MDINILEKVNRKLHRRLGTLERRKIELLNKIEFKKDILGHNRWMNRLSSEPDFFKPDPRLIEPPKSLTPFLRYMI